MPGVLGKAESADHRLTRLSKSLREGMTENGRLPWGISGLGMTGSLLQKATEDPGPKNSSPMKEF